MPSFLEEGSFCPRIDKKCPSIDSTLSISNHISGREMLSLTERRYGRRTVGVVRAQGAAVRSGFEMAGTGVLTERLMKSFGEVKS